MEGRKLKNHDKYLQKLELYAKASNLTLKWREQPEEGCYLPAVNRINIDIDLDDSVEIATILHELGHNADDMLVSENFSVQLHNAYVSLYRDTATDKQRELVIECELKAWDLAEKIANVLRIKLGKWFYKFKAQCIKSYKSA